MIYLYIYIAGFFLTPVIGVLIDRADRKKTREKLKNTEDEEKDFYTFSVVMAFIWPLIVGAFVIIGPFYFFFTALWHWNKKEVKRENETNL